MGSLGDSSAENGGLNRPTYAAPPNGSALPRESYPEAYNFDAGQRRKRNIFQRRQSHFFLIFILVDPKHNCQWFWKVKSKATKKKKKKKGKKKKKKKKKFSTPLLIL